MDFAMAVSHASGVDGHYPPAKPTTRGPDAEKALAHACDSSCIIPAGGPIDLSIWRRP